MIEPDQKYFDMLTLTGKDLDRYSEKINGPQRVTNETDQAFRMRLFAFSCLLPIENHQ
ncbi:MAG: hypothetical protein ACTHPD_09770 [Rhizomicrobium sp.]